MSCSTCLGIHPRRRYSWHSVSSANPISHPTVLKPASCQLSFFTLELASHWSWLHTGLCTRDGKGWLYKAFLLPLVRERWLLACDPPGAVTRVSLLLPCWLSWLLCIPVTTRPDRDSLRKDGFVLTVSDNCSPLWGRNGCRHVAELVHITAGQEAERLDPGPHSNHQTSTHSNLLP